MLPPNHQEASWMLTEHGTLELWEPSVDATPKGSLRHLFTPSNRPPQPRIETFSADREAFAEMLKCLALMDLRGHGLFCKNGEMTMKPIKRDRKKEVFLDKSILQRFRATINSSEIFRKNEKHRFRWNLICTLLDRIDSAVNYLNAHSNQPETEEEFIFFMVYASILKDGVYKFYENVFLKKPSTVDEKKWFACASAYSTGVFDDNNAPEDDVFFEWLRSLCFAHPYETSKANRTKRTFMRQGEVQLSPWVIPFGHFEKEDCVGVRVYSNFIDWLEDIFVPFSNLKQYLAERYSLIEEFDKWAKESIDSQNKSWAKRKTNRDLDAIGSFAEFAEIAKERLSDPCPFELAARFFAFSFSPVNEEPLKKIRAMLSKSIDAIRDALDKMDFEKATDALAFLYIAPRGLHEHGQYELEKIHTYLKNGYGPYSTGSNEEWGIIQAKNFYEHFAKRYVHIDFRTMDAEEIRLLITASCVLGCEAEENLKVECE